MKFKSLLAILSLCFLISGCNIEFYKSDDNTEKTKQEISESDINVINPSNYTGNINYAPSNQTLLTKEQVYNKTVTSSVYIIASDLENSYLGSGVFFSEDTQDDGYAYLFTNAHVVENTSNIEIVYSNYKRDKAELVGYHLLEDIAVLKVKKNNNYTIATIKESNNLNIASEIITIGTPISSDYSFTSTSGVISKLDATLPSNLDSSYYLTLIQIDASLNQGNSGGPLFDMYGNLIGLNTMKLLYDNSLIQIDDFNFSIPIERAIFVANHIFNNHPYIRGKIGIGISDIINISLQEREEKNITLDYGLYVVEVNQTSDAYNKLLTNDIITKINNISFTNQVQFQKELFKFSKGEQITLEVYRNNQYLNLTITLG